MHACVHACTLACIIIHTYLQSCISLCSWVRCQDICERRKRDSTLCTWTSVLFVTILLFLFLQLWDIAGKDYVHLNPSQFTPGLSFLFIFQDRTRFECSCHSMLVGLRQPLWCVTSLVLRLWIVPHYGRRLWTTLYVSQMASTYHVCFWLTRLDEITTVVKMFMPSG